MKLYDKLVNKQESLALVGLGYVGMPIAHAFAKKGLNVIGFDLNAAKIELYKSGVDPTMEVGDEEIKKTKIQFTADEKELQKAKFIIVAVPTPVNTDHTPDLTPVIGASELVGRNLTPGAIVVYESTVYPGCTEDVCIPILEKESGLKCGVDFKIGYSPERINPGDKVHRLENIHKIVSGIDEESLAEIKAVYDLVIAVEFAKHVKVIGFNHNEKRIAQYKAGIDPTHEVGDEAISKTTVDFTSDETRLREAKFLIVAVPTPINTDHTPDLEPVENASRIVGRNLTLGSIVVYESTVYPGVTEDICIPILEKESGLKCGVDFKIGYSPERINPGDKVHTLTTIRKIVSGMDEMTCKVIKQVYDIVIAAGTYPVSNIRTAEAVKVVENSQRDINIAFMNELAMVFDKMGIDTNEVVDGMNTKWNALGFRPGLVGGHCIGVDPYYFTYEAEKLGYHSQIILNGRIVNDSMGSYVADKAVHKMIEAGQAPKKSKVVILGLTFKENCPDCRNSKVADIIGRLNEYGIEPEVVDPWADPEVAKHEYGVELVKLEDIHDADCVIVAVAHNEFKALGVEKINSLYRKCADAEKVLIDVKGLYPIENLNTSGMKWWRL